jgi:undecaprenyl-diphosphatase
MSSYAAELFRNADAWEQRWCIRFNRACHVRIVHRFFAAISRLGDGLAWYTLMLALPLAYGFKGLAAAGRMGAVALIGLALYKYLKGRLIRERPYVAHLGIVQGTPALDRYSFPSGHTLHAVSLTTLAVYEFPALGIVLIPFALLIAASRVVLGLHYPSDVAAGALLGALLAIAACWVLPLA